MCLCPPEKSGASKKKSNTLKNVMLVLNFTFSSGALKTLTNNNREKKN